MQQKIDWTAQKKLFDWTTFRWKRFTLLCSAPSRIQFIFSCELHIHIDMHTTHRLSKSSSAQREDIERQCVRASCCVCACGPNVWIVMYEFVYRWACLTVRLCVCVCVCVSTNLRWKWDLSKNTDERFIPLWKYWTALSSFRLPANKLNNNKICLSASLCWWRWFCLVER